MRYLRNGKFLLVTALAVSVTAWGQGRRQAGRGAEAQQTGTPAAAPQAAPAAVPAAGRGGRFGPIAPETSEFYNYDTSAGSAPAFSDARPSETHGKVSVNGEVLAYTAHAGYMPLRNATTGGSEAHVFFTAYSKEGSDASSRPLMIFLGGAPGVSAAWQEFGGLGPKRMKWAEDGTAGPAPYRWADNPNTLLGEADLVFVNPVGTAYSRPDHPSAGPRFWNTSADIASLAGFVRAYLGVYSRQNSPLFLAGEDAGTGRVAGLAAYLTEHEIPVHGVVLLSMSLTADSTAGDAEYLTLFPSLVMSSWYHKKLSPEMNALSAEQISSQARQFASREYLHALYKGERITAEERTKVITDMARLTGLSKAFLINNDLRVSLERYSTELMREQHKGLSYSDARVSGFVPVAAGGRGGRGGFFGFGAPVVIDFSLSNLSGGLQTAYEAYLGQELSFKEGNHGVFYLSSGGIGTFTANGNDDAGLANAFARNPNLRLFVAIDYYDLKAPFYATEFTLAHLSVSPEVRSRNIRVSHFEAGQMAYVDNKALVKLHSDLARFLSDATSAHK